MIDDEVGLLEAARRKEESERLDLVPDNVDPENIFDITNGDCLSKRGICPLKYCRYHIAHDARDTALTKQRGQTCVLKMTTRDHTLNEVGITLGVTRERVRQLEVNAVAKVARGLRRVGLINDRDITPERLRQLMGISRRASHTSYSPRPRKDKHVQTEEHT
jgi:Sigma-70, region 4